MVQFKDKKTGEFKTAFCIKIEEGKAYVKFTENGKEYTYLQSNIEINASPKAEESVHMAFTINRVVNK